MDTAKMMDVLGTIREVISSQVSDGTHEPSPTEYFVAVVTTMKSTTELDHVDELLTILEAVTEKAHVSIVKSQFGVFSDLLAHIFKSCETPKTQTLCLSVLGSMMRMQEQSEGMWRGSSGLKPLNLFLMNIDNASNRIRKMAVTQLCALLKTHKQAHVIAARSYVADFCTAVLQGCQRSNYKRSVQIIAFLESALSYFEDAEIVTLFSLSLRIQECEQPVLIAAIYKMFDCFFQSPLISSGGGISSKHLADTMQLLLKSPPRGTDMEAIAYYCTSLASAACALHRADRSLLYSHTAGRDYMVVQIGMVLVGRCESEFSQIHCAVGTALKRLITTCVDSAAVKEAIQMADVTSRASSLEGSCVGQLVTVVQSLLHLRNQPAWVFVMDAVRTLLESVPGRAGAVLLSGVVERLADIYHAISTGVMVVSSAGVDICVRDALGSALRSLTVEHFLGIVPLRASSSRSVDMRTDLDTSRDWVLTILHSNLKLMPCRLKDFNDIVLRDAKIFNAVVKAEQKKTTLPSSQRSILHTRVVQLWSLFPAFCASSSGSTPTDLVEAFPALIPALDGALKDSVYPELMIPILSGLSSLAANVRGKYPQLTARGRNDKSEGLGLPAELTVMRSQGAKVFIPSLLGLLEQFDASDVTHFQAIVRCIAAWAGIAPASLVTSVSKKLLQLLLTASQTEAVTATTSTAAASWMAVILALIPFQSDQMITLLFRTIKPLLSVHEAVSMQKRAYKVLHGLLMHHAECIFGLESRSQILELITGSLLTCHVSARHIRLLCISSLVIGMAQKISTATGASDDDESVEGDDEQEQLRAELREACGSVFCETLICLKDSNKKTRDAALDLIKTIYSVLEPPDVLPQIYAGIVGETATMRSAAIIGLCVLVHQYQQRSHNEDGIEFNSAEYENLLDSLARLMPTVAMLMEEGSVEQTRAVLSYCKVCVGVLSTDTLVELLPGLLGSILGNVDSGTDKERMRAKFSARVRSIVRKIAHRVPEDIVRQHIPETDVALLDYIQRQSRRTASRRKDKRLYNEKLERNMIASDSEEDSDSSDDEAAGNGKTAAHKRPKATRASDIIAEGLPTSLEDLLDDEQTGPVRSGAVSSGGRERVTAANSGPVEEEDDEPYSVQVTADGHVLVVPKASEAKGKKVGRSSDMEVVDEEGQGHISINALKDSANRSEPAAVQKRKEPGAEYRSKKAGGDVWRKGMLEPHAYIPLDARLLSKKNSKTAVSQMGSTVSNKKRRTGGPDESGSSKGGSHKRVMTMLGRKQRQAMMKSKK